MAAIALLAGCGGEEAADEPERPSTITADVEVELGWPFARPYEFGCQTDYEYGSVRDRIPVVIKDENGAIVGQETLTEGDPPDERTCMWTASFDRADSDSEYFTAELGGWTSAPVRRSGDTVSFTMTNDGSNPDPGWDR
ncbi:hypothetical protein JL108_06115 [Aeromicrobium sp. YIM 150415]|uniref:hypothetical protein n=1 Tax=Aeromicrobium sp. YIM 150415 TaxID=2803912 RepID=UPI00196244CD|nr:hypothetical protein [Aeromicrobium sp. YIM 150415]MBM9463019.1 hypothetical protein [Aeromicrobium sp. YIM 150415]